MSALNGTDKNQKPRGIRVDDIRPDDVMVGQEAAMMEDVAWLEARRGKFQEVNCPACSNNDARSLYQKFSLDHVLCNACGTQYANPRPPAELLAEFYRQSTNYAYWAEHVFSASHDVRLEKIFTPRAKILTEALHSKGHKGGTLLEVGAAYGLFCEAVRQTNYFDKIMAIEPTPRLAQICRDLGFETHECSYEHAHATEVAAVAAFEVIEHLHDPSQFLRWSYRALQSGGCLFLTCPNIRGLETIALGREAGSVDHEHINMFHPGSLKILLEACGFSDVEITTPGQLDFDLVHRAYKEGRVSEKEIGSFLTHLIKTTDEETAARFQAFLQETKLSSHMMAICYKPE